MSIFDQGGFMLPDDMDPDEQELLAKAKHVSATVPFHAVWHALGRSHICLAVPDVQLVLLSKGDNAIIGVMYLVQHSIWSGPDVVSPDDREAMLLATASVFRSMGGIVERAPGSEMMKVAFDGGPTMDVNADPFGSEVEDFIRDMDKALGPSTSPDPNDPWSRWM